MEIEMRGLFAALANFMLPWVLEVFLACSGNLRYWPKADTSSAVGPKPRAGHYKDLTETGNRARKSDCRKSIRLQKFLM